MRKRQAVAAVTAIILGVTGCSGNTRTAATTAQTTAAQETTVSGETTAAQETTAAESETDSQDSVQAGTAVNPEIYTGLTEEEVSQIEASMEEILANNPLGLVYNGAITENVEGEVNIRPVSYQNQQGIDLAANLYLPAGYDENGSYAAIVVAHPNGGVKEQVSGLFAQRLAENGYITIAFDAAYQGASGGVSRQTDRPANRVEDIRAAIDYLSTVAGVDTSPIGALGIRRRLHHRGFQDGQANQRGGYHQYV